MTALLLAVGPMGLSPLARGNLSAVWMGSGATGPIPARAGEPRSMRAPVALARAYPRSRGGTSGADIIAPMASGLSPLARGNPPLVEPAVAGQGPIPARAGEPSASSSEVRSSRAYPRSRGGTDVVT